MRTNMFVKSAGLKTFKAAPEKLYLGDEVQNMNH